MNRVFYTIEIWTFELSGLEQEEMHFRLFKEDVTREVPAILREIERLPSYYWNARSEELMETKDECIRTIETTIDFLTQNWVSLRFWYTNVHSNRAQSVFARAFTLLNECFQMFNRLNLVQHCLHAQRLSMVRRLG